MVTPNVNENLISTPQHTSDDILHWGVKGMKWGRRKNRASGSSTTINPKTGSIMRRFRKVENPIVVKERERQRKFVKEYYNRDKMSVKTIKARTDRLNAEYAFKKAIEQPIVDKQKAAAEKRARRAKLAIKIAGGAAVGALVYSGIRAKQLSGSEPSLGSFNLKKEGNVISGKRSNYNEYLKAVKKHKQAKATVKLINDAARVTVGMIQGKVLKNSGLENEEILQHHGIKGMKWGRRKATNTGSPATIVNPKTGGILRKFRKKDTTTPDVQLSKSDKRKQLAKRILTTAAVGAATVGAAYAVNKYARHRAIYNKIPKKNYKLKQPLGHKLIKEGLGYRAPNGRVNNIGDKVGIYYDTNRKLKYDPHAFTRETDHRGHPTYIPKFYGDKPSSSYVEGVVKNTFSGSQPKYRYKGKVKRKTTIHSRTLNEIRYKK
uniref:Structural protein n=1 Tax=Siphoviridae sp. ctGpg14 TaxID=2827824 RepID=A0A8S5T5P5_9CAUD|nr:MAG TPA: Structural protein [Siphoviridae sp. ctGpg14]